jgi:hypothetical protein
MSTTAPAGRGQVSATTALTGDHRAVLPHHRVDMLVDIRERLAQLHQDPPRRQHHPQPPRPHLGERFQHAGVGTAVLGECSVEVDRRSLGSSRSAHHGGGSLPSPASRSTPLHAPPGTSVLGQSASGTKPSSRPTVRRPGAGSGPCGPRRGHRGSRSCRRRRDRRRREGVGHRCCPSDPPLPRSVCRRRPTRDPSS